MTTSQIQHHGSIIEVPKGYEELVKAILKCGIHIAAIGLEPVDDEFFVNFQCAPDCEQFADLIVACAPKELMDKLFGDNACLTGSFSIDTTEEDDEDSYRTHTVMEMCLPIALRDDLTQVFQAASKIVESDVSYCESNGRRSNGSINHQDPVPKAEWDGNIFANVAGVDDLAPGELVKLTFHASKPHHIMERLWVKVTVVDDDEVRGTIDSHPAALTNLHRGDTVDFHKWQIMRVSQPRKQAEASRATLN